FLVVYLAPSTVDPYAYVYNLGREMLTNVLRPHQQPVAAADRQTELRSGRPGLRRRRSQRPRRLFQRQGVRADHGRAGRPGVCSMTGQPTAAEALRALAARFRKRIDDPRYDDDMY